jgi:hypothetical protein
MKVFRPIDLDDRDRITERLHRHPPEISEHTFTNMYIWRHHRPTFWGELSGGALVFVVGEPGAYRLFGPPAGDFNPVSAVEELRAAGVVAAERLTGGAGQDFESAGLEARPDRDNSDYVYLRSDLAELSGRRYHRKKNMVNRCLNAHDCEYCELTTDVLAEVAELQERWCGARECGEDPDLCAEYRAIHDALGNFARFGLTGGAVRISGRIEAFAIGEALSEETAVVHFEKAMTDYQGLYQLINMWFCEHGLAGFEYVNREQDLGVPGLRKAKESYLPHHMVEKHFVALEAGAAEQPVMAGARGRCAEHGDAGEGDQ